MRYRSCTRQAREEPGKNCVGGTTETKTCGNPCQKEGNSHCKQVYFSLIIIILKCVGCCGVTTLDMKVSGLKPETSVPNLVLLLTGIRFTPNYPTYVKSLNLMRLSCYGRNTAGGSPAKH